MHGLASGASGASDASRREAREAREAKMHGLWGALPPHPIEPQPMQSTAPEPAGRDASGASGASLREAREARDARRGSQQTPSLHITKRQVSIFISPGKRVMTSSHFAGRTTLLVETA